MDYTSMTDLLSCARKYELGRKKRIQTHEDKQALRFGSLWHETQFLESPEKAAQKLLWEDPADDYRTLDKVARGYYAWCQRYINRKRKYLLKEMKFEDRKTPVFEPSVGICDAIVEMDVNQGKGEEQWLVDYKTASRLDSDWVTFYRLSNQFKLYYVSLLHLYPLLAGVVVDLFHATKGTKSGKTEADRDGNRFYELIIRYEQEELDEAIKDYNTACEVREFYEAKGYYPKNTGACHAYGTSCPFVEYCEGGDAVKAALMLSFTVKEKAEDDGRTIIA